MTEAPYGTTAAGAAARCWTLASPDLEVVVTDYGATVLSCRYRGRELTLQYASLAEIEVRGLPSRLPSLPPPRLPARGPTRT